ncbi:MAG: hypothetical protein HQK51_13955 [Oligoflexia bacterium]|nr:hypothetical protein [Oligoflexia bacterium]
MSKARIREISLDDLEEESNNKREVCFVNPEEALPDGILTLGYIYSFDYRSSTSIRDGLMIGRYRIFEKDQEKSMISENFCAITFHDEQFFISPMPGSFKVAVNKTEVKALEEGVINVGDLIEVSTLGKFVIVDKEDVTEEEAKGYIGKRLVSNTFKQSAASLESIKKEVENAEADVTRKDSNLKELMHQFKKMEQAKQEIIKFQRFVAQMEAVNLPLKISTAKGELVAAEEMFANKKKTQEILIKRLSEFKEREQQKALEEKVEIERQIRELREKHKQLEKKVKK